MIDHDVLPVIAIAGGCGALLLLACICLAVRRPRIARSTPRKTSFHMAVIDPAIAEQGRAAWELVALPVIQPPGDVPRRFARGSQPGIEQPAHGTQLTARPHGWDVHHPSVTARMRAVRRPT